MFWVWYEWGYNFAQYSNSIRLDLYFIIPLALLGLLSLIGGFVTTVVQFRKKNRTGAADNP